MKNFFVSLFDLIFPRRPNDAAIADISPADFYEKIPRWDAREIYPNMHAIFRYKDPTAKAMVKEFKSSRNEHAARIGAHALASFLQESGIDDAIIIPMPISKKRRKKRGYNQCEFILVFFMREVASTDLSSLGLNAHFEIRTDILEKTIDTPKLALQNRAARLQANKGAFKALAPLSHIKKQIIVIDDVITTGSTMHSALEALRHAGAKNVFGVGIAH